MLSHKKGKCIDCGKETFLIAKRCKYHYWMHRKKEKRGDKQTLFSFFEEIWSEREHTSYLSGKSIPYFNVSNFAHVVRRSKTSALTMEKANIVLLTAEEHHLFDNGTEAQRLEYAKKNSLSWDKLFLLRESLLSRL